MNELWNYFKKFFRNAEASSPSKPFLHEVIERSEAEKIAYARWKETLVKKRLIDWLYNQYINFLVNPNHTDRAVDFLDTPSSKGFVVHFRETGYTKPEITHFFDFLKEQVLTLNYKSYLSDIRTYNRPDWVETLQRHYLKPRTHLKKEEKIEQRFGNITIEMLMRNEKVHDLKFRATAYHDHLFEKAAEFKELMQEILR